MNPYSLYCNVSETHGLSTPPEIRRTIIQMEQITGIFVHAIGQFMPDASSVVPNTQTLKVQFRFDQIRPELGKDRTTPQVIYMCRLKNICVSFCD